MANLILVISLTGFGEIFSANG